MRKNEKAKTYNDAPGAAACARPGAGRFRRAFTARVLYAYTHLTRRGARSSGAGRPNDLPPARAKRHRPIVRRLRIAATPARWTTDATDLTNRFETSRVSYARHVTQRAFASRVISGNLGVRSRDGVRALFAREHRSARYDATVHHNQPAMTPLHKTAAGCLKSPASIR